MSNLKGKAGRSLLAMEHTTQMEELYSNDIRNCILNSSVYGPHFAIELDKFNIRPKQVDIALVPEDSVTAVMYNPTEGTNTTALLNFASYKNPGGMFLAGAIAQEEAICHESILFNVLKEFPDYYAWNNLSKNRALYLDRAIYSKDVLFLKNYERFKADVITCACPNKKAAQEYCEVTNEENYEVLKQRIGFVLKMAAINRVDTLILGAFGCGVFGQDPIEVATIFKEYLGKYPFVFDKVIFAIPNKESANYLAFNEILNGE